MRDGASSHLWNVNSDSLTIENRSKKGTPKGGGMSIRIIRGRERGGGLLDKMLTELVCDRASVVKYPNLMLQRTVIVKIRNEWEVTFR